MALLKLSANAGGSPGGVTIWSPTSTTVYSPLEIDWGNYSPDPNVIVRGDGSLRAAPPSWEPRRISIGLRAAPGSTRDALTAAKTLVTAEAIACARSGGMLRWQANGASYPISFRVVGCRCLWGEGAQQTETQYRTDGMLELDIDPAALGDPMGFVDTFDADSIADYTFDAGAATLSVGGGVLVASSTAAKRLRHTARGYAYTDVEATLRITTGSTVAAGDWAVGIRASTAGADTMLMARLSTSAAQLQAAKAVSSAVGALATAAFTPVASTTYWLRARVEASLLVAELFTSEPSPTATPAATATYVLTAGEADQFRSGHVVLRITPASTGETYDDLAVRPFTYRSSITTPDVLRLTGIPGDLPALCDVDITQPAAVNSAAAWGMVAWGARPFPVDLVANGNFETDVQGWSVAAVTGVTGAATSIATDNTTKKYGSQSGKVTCPATANTGATYAMRRRFHRGRTYVGCCWRFAATGTTAARIRLGVNGDVVSGSATALGPAPAFEAIAWRPAATVDTAYFCGEITAAAAQVWNLDGVDVFEAIPAALQSPMLAGDTTLVVSAQPPEAATLPVPFVCVIDNELVQVLDARTTTWQIRRGVDGTTAAAHSAAAPVYIWPGRSRDWVDGAHGNALCDIIEAEGAHNLVNLASTGDAAARDAFKLAPSGSASSFSAQWFIDPGTLTPREYSDGEQLLEVWARVELASSLVTPRIVTSAQPDDGSGYGAVRYDLENGQAGLAPTLPSSGSAWRFLRLGVVPVLIDPDVRRRRVALTVTINVGAAVNAGVGLDYLVLVHPAARCAPPTGLAQSDASYPAFFPSAAETTRRVRYDLSSGLARPPRGVTPSGGIIGAPVLLPVPNADVLVKLSRLVPGDTTASATSEDGSAAASASYAGVAVSINPTPRYMVIR